MKQRNFLRLRHAKAHDDGTLKNPLFARTPPKYWVKIFFGILVLSAILGAIVALTYLPVLQLQGVSVQGTTTLDPTAIESRIRQTLSEHSFPFCAKENIYTVSVRALEEAVRAHFSVERVSVERDGSALNVLVEEKVTTIALRTKEKTVMLDLTGSYVRDATPEESRAIDIRIGTATPNADETVTALQADMPIVLDTQNDAATALSEATATSILQIADHIGTVGFHPVAYTIDGLSAPFVRVDTDAQYDLYFDLFSRPIDEQIRALQAVVTRDGFALPKEYLDLRFGAYVYMK